MHELGKLDLYKDKSIIMEVQDKICPSCVSQENPTRVKRNPPWRRLKIKYA